MSAVREIRAGLMADQADGAAAELVQAATAVTQAWAVPVAVGAAAVCHAAAVECAVAAGGDVSREVKL